MGASGSNALSERVFGLVLCGGASRRMGTDKARLELGERTLIEHALECLRPIVERTLLACGSQARHAELGHMLVLDRAPALGPLAGLEAGLSAARESAGANAVVCMLACDMPFASTAGFEILLARRERDGLDLCLAQSESGAEPLFAVQHVRLLPFVRALLDRGERRMSALENAVLDDGTRVRAGRVVLAERYATNLNTPLELARARTAWAASNRSAVS